jgi:hypothetical protein
MRLTIYDHIIILPKRTETRPGPLANANLPQTPKPCP